MNLWAIYNEDVPGFILDFAETDVMTRLKDVGMNCGLEYTEFPIYKTIERYTRYDHSVGFALIIWHFTHDIKQAVAGLLHDISTPAFAHVVDFLNNDYMVQESTEAKTKEIIETSPQIMNLLSEYDLNVEDVCDYHKYSVADNDSPKLSADRLEYTLGNAVNFRFISCREAEVFFRDLTVTPDEIGTDEIAFRSEYLACAFTEAALSNSKVYVSDEDRYAMQYLANILRLALELDVLNENCLYTTEPEVIKKLIGKAETATLWNKYRGFSQIHTSQKNPNTPEWISIYAKKRYIDPLVEQSGRVSKLSENVNRDIMRFLHHDFNYWITAE